MSFSGPIRAEWLPDGITMRLLEDVTFTDSRGRQWQAWAGFVTDGASIPPQLWSLIGSPYTGKYRAAAVFHDAAYATTGVLQADADAMLREAAIELGCPAWIADALYRAVVEFGRSPYVDDQVRSTHVLKVTKVTTMTVEETPHG